MPNIRYARTHEVVITARLRTHIVTFDEGEHPKIQAHKAIMESLSEAGFNVDSLQVESFCDITPEK